MKNELSRLLSIGLIQGKNSRAIAKDLKKYWYGPDPKTKGGARYCMERLMRTELARVQTEAQKQSFVRNGFAEYTFHTNHGCCPICAALDGKHFKVSKMMAGTNAPPMHPMCRCSVSAYEDSDEYEAWLDYLSKGGTTEQWNKIKYSDAKSKKRVENLAKAKYNDDEQGALTHRRIGENGRQMCNKALYNKLTKPVLKKGGHIELADDEWMRYLEENNATAVTFGDSIILRYDATTTEVLEEVYHFNQNRAGLNNQYKSDQRKIMNEIEAQEYLISVADNYNIPEAEREETKALLDWYKNQKEELIKAGDWVD